MRRLLIVGVVLSAFAAGSALEARKQNYTTYGVGTQSCGKWLEARRDTDRNLQYTFGSWVRGWLSAAGYYGTVLKKTDTAAIDAWVDNFCSANPLLDMDDAARGLVTALTVK
ncbi:MAG: hypothetical protein JW395_0177 [Nitrospira sp.]|nr:hypothetical protein [Nitrospira sp.]